MELRYFILYIFLQFLSGGFPRANALNVLVDSGWWRFWQCMTGYN